MANRSMPQWDTFGKGLLTLIVVALGVVGLLIGKLTGAEAVDLIKTVVAAYIAAALVAEGIRSFATRQ
jgi:hypothetical protein